MKRTPGNRFPTLLPAAFVLILFGITVASCGKKRVTPPPAAVATGPVLIPVPSAPTVTITASPAVIDAGRSSTLTWQTRNAAAVQINEGVGVVAVSGSRSVSPYQSTTYTAFAEGPGGKASASTRVTVVAPPPPALPPLWTGDVFGTRIRDVFFDFDKYDLRPDAALTLERNAAALTENPGIQITIEGHCDERGSEKYNLALGDRRANAAKDFLVSKGVSDSRIDMISYGEERPFETGHDEVAWASNRRAHFVLRIGPITSLW